MTTTPPPPAGSHVPAVTLEKTRAFWPVSLSVDTPHDAFRIVKLSSYSGWYIAEWNGRTWIATDPSSATVADAQTRVRTRVALREFAR